MDKSSPLTDAKAMNLPRYTSYPPTNHFNANGNALLNLRLRDAVQNTQVLSVYIHVPYCDKLCWFCGCNTKHTLSYEPIAKYIDVLTREIESYATQRTTGLSLAKLHLGGGSPSLLRRAELRKIRHALETVFTIDDRTEISIELDPSDLDARNVDDFMEFGMTRASIGVQDFDPEIQKAINRPQSFATTKKVVDQLREAGVKSVNIDALYGLPGQTLTKLASSIEKVVNLKPDRIALFGYAHVPWVKPHQRLIDESALPNAGGRLRHSAWAAKYIVEAGYQKIGIDHFALPTDTLAIAHNEKRLRRNFQGYTDDECPVMLGLGPSSISRFLGGYAQNETATGSYTTKILAGGSAIARGVLLSEQDIVRGWIIEKLMCDFAFSKAELLQAHGKAGLEAWSFCREVAKQCGSELCKNFNDNFIILPEAQPLVRIVAAKFDEWLESSDFRYSKAV